MSELVVSGAMMTCSFGMAPSALTVLPINRTNCGTPAATIMDMQPMVNIASFGMCMSPSNPMVAAATAAAFGVLVPMPCIPVTVSAWNPGSPTVAIGGMPALNSTSMCNCMWGGVIQISMAGQMVAQIP